MVEVTGVNIAIRGRGEVDQGPTVLSFLVNIAQFGGLLQNILWRVADHSDRLKSAHVCHKSRIVCNEGYNKSVSYNETVP